MTGNRLSRLCATTFLLLALFLTGCATTRPAAPPAAVPDSSAACLEWFAAADAAVTAADRRDVQAARLPGRPHLRVDRLLAALAAETPTDDAYTAWLDHAAALARDGWRVELANLPPAARRELAGASAGDDPGPLAVACIDRLRAADAADPARAAALLADARVPDAYADWQRVVGLYPLTRWLVLARYRAWQEGIDAQYARPLDALPVAGTLHRYASPLPAAPPAVGPWRRDALGYPQLDPQQRAALFAAHAPLWEVDSVSRDDRPGRPYWPSGSWRARVDVDQPTLYRHLSFTRVGGRILPQLNYLLWFPARTPQREGDIYAGPHDGVLLRVTLNDDGTVLLYDAIHSCGCYHMFFPGLRLVPRPLEEVGGEGYHVPQRAPYPGPGERLALRLEAGTHMVLRLHPVPAATPATPLAVAPYDTLRSLADGAGRRSLFGPDGLVAGSGRSERFLLWPMGVPSAGAMRQWGRHATAFVGRRHFDDPGLVEAGFRLGAAPHRQPDG
jgi:hypothetical protein